jgi:hypothetical protein
VQLALGWSERPETFLVLQGNGDRRPGTNRLSVLPILGKLGRVGQRLLSMNLHLLPVKEWSLGGEVSVPFFKGSISVTFGK